jgi:hypothetical protein
MVVSPLEREAFLKWLLYEDKGWRDDTPTMPSVGARN